MKRATKLVMFMLIVSLMLLSVGCGATNVNAEDQGKNIIDADQVAVLLDQENVALVDMQSADEYKKAHIKGAVNIPLSDIVMNIPVKNMLAAKGKLEKTLGTNGISNETTVIIYDNSNNMDAARMWWTLMVYGHDEEKIKVVSGGWNALKLEGLEVTKKDPAVMKVKYTAKDKNKSMIATIKDVKAQVNDPQNNIVLLDTRSQDEYDEGTIPGSLLLDYSENNYADGTYKIPDHIQIQYIEKGIDADKTVIMFCKTSIRGAQTYLALYNAGYRNLKLYDGAWVEWSANKSLPVQTPTGNKIEFSQQDNS